MRDACATQGVGKSLINGFTPHAHADVNIRGGKFVFPVKLKQIGSIAAERAGNGTYKLCSENRFSCWGNSVADRQLGVSANHIWWEFGDRFLFQAEASYYKLNFRTLNLASSQV